MTCLAKKELLPAMLPAKSKYLAQNLFNEPSCIPFDIQEIRLSSRVEPGQPKICSYKALLAGLSPQNSPSENHSGFFSSRKAGSCEEKITASGEKFLPVSVSLWPEEACWNQLCSQGEGDNNLRQVPDKTKVCRRGGSLPAPTAARRGFSWRST